MEYMLTLERQTTMEIAQREAYYSRMRSSPARKFASKLQLPRVGRSKFVENRETPWSGSVLEVAGEIDITTDCDSLEEVARSSLDKQIQNIIETEDDQVFSQHAPESRNDFSSYLLSKPQQFDTRFAGNQERLRYDLEQNHHETNCIFSADTLFCAAACNFSRQNDDIPGEKKSNFEFKRKQLFTNQPSSSALQNIDFVMTPFERPALLDGEQSIDESSTSRTSTKHKHNLHANTCPSVPEYLLHGPARNIFILLLEDFIRERQTHPYDLTRPPFVPRQEPPLNCAARIIFDDIMQVNMTAQTRMSRLQRALKTRKVNDANENEEPENEENEDPAPSQPGAAFQVSQATRRIRLSKATRRVVKHMDRPKTLHREELTSSHEGGFWSLKYQHENSRVTKLLKKRKYGASPKYKASVLAASFFLYVVRLKAQAENQKTLITYVHGPPVVYCNPVERQYVTMLMFVVWCLENSDLRDSKKGPKGSNIPKSKLFQRKKRSKKRQLKIDTDHRTTIASEYSMNSPRPLERIQERIAAATSIKKEITNESEEEELETDFEEEMEFFYQDSLGHLVHPSLKVFVVTAMIETDLARDKYIDAHRKNPVPDISEEDDGLSLELMILPWLEAELRIEFAEIDDNEYDDDASTEETCVSAKDIEVISSSESQTTIEIVYQAESGNFSDSGDESSNDLVETERELSSNTRNIHERDDEWDDLSDDNETEDEDSYDSRSSQSSFNETEARYIVQKAIANLDPTADTAIPMMYPLMEGYTPSPENSETWYSRSSADSKTSDEAEDYTVQVSLYPMPSTSSLSEGAGSVSVAAQPSKYHDVPSLLSTTSMSTANINEAPAENIRKAQEDAALRSPENQKSEDEDLSTIKGEKLVEEEGGIDVEIVDFQPPQPEHPCDGLGALHRELQACFHDMNVDIARECSERQANLFTCVGEATDQGNQNQQVAQHLHALTEKASVRSSSLGSERSFYVIRSVSSLDTTDPKLEEVIENTKSTAWSTYPILASISGVSDLSGETGLWSLEPHMAPFVASELHQLPMKVGVAAAREMKEKTIGLTEKSDDGGSAVGSTSQEMDFVRSSDSYISAITFENWAAESPKSLPVNDEGLHNISIDDSNNVETQLNEVVLPSNSSGPASHTSEDKSMDIPELLLEELLLESSTSTENFNPSQGHQQGTDLTSSYVRDFALQVLHVKGIQYGQKTDEPIILNKEGVLHDKDNTTARTWTSTIPSSTSEGETAKQSRVSHSKYSSHAKESSEDWDTSVIFKMRPSVDWDASEPDWDISGDWDMSFDPNKKRLDSEPRQKSTGWSLGSFGEMILSPFRSPEVHARNDIIEAKLSYVRQF